MRCTHIRSEREFRWWDSNPHRRGQSPVHLLDHRIMNQIGMVGFEPTQDRGSKPRALPIELHPKNGSGETRTRGTFACASAFQAGAENHHPRHFQRTHNSNTHTEHTGLEPVKLSPSRFQDGFLDHSDMFQTEAVRLELTERDQPFADLAGRCGKPSSASLPNGGRRSRTFRFHTSPAFETGCPSHRAASSKPMFTL